MKLTENTPEKRVVDEENEENVQDSQGHISITPPDEPTIKIFSFN